MRVKELNECPSVDGGSEWFENMTGKSSYAGTLTFSITPGKPNYNGTILKYYKPQHREYPPNDRMKLDVIRFNSGRCHQFPFIY